MSNTLQMDSWRTELWPGDLFLKPKNVKWQNIVVMTLLSIIIFIFFCWWIFALISKQALLKMCFYYLCHGIGRARLMLMMSQFFGCQQKLIDATDYSVPLHKQLKRNPLQWDHSGPCWGNPSCHKVRRQLKAVKPQWSNSNPPPIPSCVTCFFLPFNNLCSGVSVVIKMGLVLFIFIREFQSTMALYASAALMLPSFMR